MSNGKLRNVKLALMCLLLIATSIYGCAQTATGEIVGRVSDINGAVIVGAKVTATEVGTGRVANTTSNAEGNFQFPLLQPGKYEVVAGAPGMAKSLVRVEVLLGAHQSVNFQLKPGAAETVVEVSGEAPVIDTTGSELKANIDPKQMSELPLNGRTFASLAVLAPGVRPVGSFDPTKSRIGTVSIGGSTGRNFNLTVDGGDNKDNIVGGFLQNYTTEGIQEFVINTNKFGADTGKSGGGVVTIATKGGTNSLHGGAFVFARNRNLNAMDYFTAHQSDPKKAPFDRQNYGGSISGPLKKDKLFFFAAVEHTHEMSSVAQTPEALQTLTDFVQLRQAAPLGISELQNLPISLKPAIPVPFLDTQFQGRADWNINSNNTLFVRYAQQNNHLQNDQLTGWADISNGATTINDLNSILGNWTRTISPTMVNQFVFQFSHFYNGMLATPVGNNIAELCFNSGACLGMGENVPQTTTQNKFQFHDDFLWHRGNHSLKFGFQDIYTRDVGGTIAYDVSPWVYLRCDPADILYNIGQVNSGGSPDPSVCHGATSLDSPGTVRQIGLAGGNPSYMQHNIHQVSYYAQDDWKITPHLTLNLGVRNDVDFALVPTDNQVHNRAVELLTAIGMNPGLPKTDLNNWAPRVGFAWDPTGKGRWVLRGGFGLFYDQLFTNTILHATQQANPDVYSVLYQVRYGSGAMGVTNGLNDAIAAVGQWPITSAPDLPYGSRGRYISKGFQTPYSQQFTIGTQIELSKNMSLAVDYIHTLDLHQFAARDVNPAVDGSGDSRILNSVMDPLFGCRNPADGTTTVANCSLGGMQHKMGRITEAGSNSRSRYDALTFNFKRQFSNRFTFGASYVLSRSLTYGGQAYDWGNESQGIYPGLTGWQSQLKGIIGPQNFGYASEDERHRVVLNSIVNIKGGFTVSGIVQLSSARPYTMLADDDINGDGVFNDVYSNIVTKDPTFDPIWGGDSRYAIRSKNQLRGDPYYQTDLRVQKTFSFRDRLKVSLVADMFNLFNTTNFGNSFQGYADALGIDVPTTLYDCSASSCTFPTAKQLPRDPTALFGGGVGGAGTVGIPFQAQLGLRISF